jgi:hypothetical protein
MDMDMSRIPPPLRKMPPLAAAATECRLVGTARKIHRKTNPSKGHKCSVRMQGDLNVRYRIREVGGPELPTVVHVDAPRRFDQSFKLYDLDAYFHSCTAYHDAIHQMLMQTPVLREFDLSADNWDNFMPHTLASMNVGYYRHDTEKHGGFAHRYSIDMTLKVWANLNYNEPKELHLACLHQAASATEAAATMPAAECGVCMDDLAAQDAVRLPCSHSFHRDYPALVLQGGNLPNVSPRLKQLPRCCHQHAKRQVSWSRILVIRIS